MSNLPQLEIVSWQDFHQLCFDLHQEIKSKEQAFDQIISIARGGHIAARILSDFMSLPIFSISIQSYKDFQQHELVMTQEMVPELVGQRILLVDEMVDSGKSLQRALNHLADIGAKQIISASLHVKPQANPKPNYFGSITQNWVVYPYEVRETIESLKGLCSDTDELANLKKLLLAKSFNSQIVNTYF